MTEDDKDKLIIGYSVRNFAYIRVYTDKIANFLNIIYLYVMYVCLACIAVDLLYFRDHVKYAVQGIHPKRLSFCKLLYWNRSF